jgi:hypothetical protein
MIKVPRHQRNVDVSTFPDWFAIIEGLEDSQPAKMLLRDKYKSIFAGWLSSRP